MLRLDGPIGRRVMVPIPRDRFKLREGSVVEAGCAEGSGIGDGQIVWRGALNVRHGQAHEDFGFLVADSRDALGRDQNLLAGKLVPGLDGKFRHGPTPVVDH